MERLILDLLFPRRCPLCGKIARGICRDCADHIPYVRQPYCFRCGRPLTDPAQEYCAHCRALPAAYLQGRSVYCYTGAVREAMHAIKYNNKREYLEYFARDMAQKLGDVIRAWDPQVLLPVPMYPSAKRRRGYNQAELLAKLLGGYLRIPVNGKTLKKIKKTADQKSLDQRARRVNLEGAFAVGEAPWRRVLVVDDIYTTGSTMREISAVLRRAGVEQIYFATLCTVPETMDGAQ